MFNEIVILVQPKQCYNPVELDVVFRIMYSLMLIKMYKHII